MGNCLFINRTTRNIAKEIIDIWREGLKQVTGETTRDSWYPEDGNIRISTIEDELDTLLRHGFSKAGCNPRDVNEQLRHLIAYEIGNGIIFRILQTKTTLGATLKDFFNTTPEALKQQHDDRLRISPSIDCTMCPDVHKDLFTEDAYALPKYDATLIQAYRKTWTELNATTAIHLDTTLHMEKQMLFLKAVADFSEAIAFEIEIPNVVLSCVQMYKNETDMPDRERATKFLARVGAFAKQAVPASHELQNNSGSSEMYNAPNYSASVGWAVRPNIS